MEVYLKTVADHSNRIVNARLLVQNELLRQQMDNLAVGGQRNRAGAIHGSADVFASDLAQTRSQADAAPAVHSANMRAADADDTTINGPLRHGFSRSRRFIDRLRGLLQIGNQ